MGAAAARARAAARDRIEESFMVGAAVIHFFIFLFLPRGGKVEAKIEVKDWD